MNIDRQTDENLGKQSRIQSRGRQAGRQLRRGQIKVDVHKKYRQIKLQGYRSFYYADNNVPNTAVSEEKLLIVEWSMGDIPSCMAKDNRQT